MSGDNIDKKINYFAKKSGEGVVLTAARETAELLSEQPACMRQAEAARELADKLAARRETVAVIGQFKRGKSALSNAILGFGVMPVGIIPITAAATRVNYGAETAAVAFENGEVRDVSFGELSSYISEQENPGNRLGVREVRLTLPSPFLKGNITFLDTPGVGSFHKNNTETAYSYMRESDAVIFLLSVDSPINQIEIDFLAGTRDFAGKFYFAVNKTDLVSEEELAAYEKYCGELLSELTGFEEIRLFPLSAKSGRGVEELKNAVISDRESSVAEIMEKSTAKKLSAVIRQALRQLDFQRKAMSLSYGVLDLKFAELSAFISELRARANELAASAEKQNYRLRLNEIKREIKKEVDRLFDMEYELPIEELRDDESGAQELSAKAFLSETERLFAELEAVLGGVLLYREENSYAVAHRINAINRLRRRLWKIRDMMLLEAEAPSHDS